jgi:hypothetical protein
MKIVKLVMSNQLVVITTGPEVIFVRALEAKRNL